MLYGCRKRQPVFFCQKRESNDLPSLFFSHPTRILGLYESPDRARIALTCYLPAFAFPFAICAGVSILPSVPARIKNIHIRMNIIASPMAAVTIPQRVNLNALAVSSRTTTSFPSTCHVLHLSTYCSPETIDYLHRSTEYVRRRTNAGIACRAQI